MAAANMKFQEQPLITIAIPTYNRAGSTFPEALQSALAQTYQHLEILISDNASTDETSRLVDGIDDPRVRYIRHTSNMLANENFNFCVEHANGAFLLLLHDDDAVDPEFVEMCVRAYEGRSDVGIIRTGMRVISSDGEVLSESENHCTGSDLYSFVDSWLLHRTSPYCCNTLLRTSALRDAGGFKSRKLLFQDVHTQVRIAACWETVNVRPSLASFRRHEANMGSGARIDDWCLDSLDLLTDICRLLPNHSKELHRRGLQFFAQMNYGYTLALQSFLARARTYLMVALRFRFAVSPVRFALRHDIKPKLKLVHWRRK